MTYVVDLLAAIPSVVYGFWALAVLTTPATNVYTNIAELDRHGARCSAACSAGRRRGASFMTAGHHPRGDDHADHHVAVSREALITVAQDDKNGALAMGATRWEMLRVAVFPRVRSGLIGAAMLGLGRAMGETIAVALVIGEQPRRSRRTSSAPATRWRR